MADLTFWGMKTILDQYCLQKKVVCQKDLYWRLDRGPAVVVPPKHSWQSAKRFEFSLVLYEGQSLKEIARSKPVNSIRCNVFNAEQLGYLLGTLKEIENE